MTKSDLWSTHCKQTDINVDSIYKDTKIPKYLWLGDLRKTFQHIFNGP